MGARELLAEILPRRLAVAIGVRRLSPAGCYWPHRGVRIDRPAGDTGGGYRPDERPQNPGIDPREPDGGESASSGDSHGWSNCTMSSGAIALAYHTLGAREPWGGHLRHEQGDQSGGTDLYDLRTAWSNYAGESLTIRSGAGWGAVVDAHDEKRAIVLQGTGQVPGEGDYDGAHAVCVGIDSKDGKWLLYDPLCTAYQWVSPSSLKEWAQRFSSSICFAVSRVVEEEEPEEPEEPDEPDPPPPPPKVWRAEGPPALKGEEYRAGFDAGRSAELDRTFSSWAPGRPWEPPKELDGARWDLAEWGGEGSRFMPDAWGDWPIPLIGLYRAQELPTWGEAMWAGAVWRD